MVHTRRAHRLVSLLLAAAAAVGPTYVEAQPAAPDPVTVEEARAHFAAGQKLFEAGNLKGAVEELKEAYRLSKNPLLLYNVGLVYDQLGDAPLALHYFAKFIDEQKDTEKTHDRLVQASQRAAELRKKIGEEPAAPPAPATQPAETPALVHEPVSEAPPGRPIDLTARVADDAGLTVLLSYRHAGEEAYQQVKMQTRPGLGPERVARIPAAAVQGTALQYFIAVRDGEGKLVASSGKASAPNVVLLDRAAPLHAFADENDEPVGGHPTAAPAIAPAPFAEPETPRSPYFYPKWIASGTAVVLFGTGVGFALAARSYAETLQAEAVKSSSHECDPLPPPCRPYDAPHKNLEKTGQAYATWANVGFIAAAAVAAGAGALWFLDERAEPAAAPIVGPGTIGAAATVHF
jgi:hypothetical protein